MNEPLHQQYLSFLSNAVQFDFGTSWRTGREVSSEIAPRFFVTLELAIYSTILSVFLGVIAGVISAVRRYSLTDVTIMLVALFGLSMPNFWLGLMLMQWFAVKLDWLPATGWGSGFPSHIACHRFRNCGCGYYREDDPFFHVGNHFSRLYSYSSRERCYRKSRYLSTCFKKCHDSSRYSGWLAVRIPSWRSSAHRNCFCD